MKFLQTSDGTLLEIFLSFSDTEPLHFLNLNYTHTLTQHSYMNISIFLFCPYVNLTFNLQIVGKLTIFPQGYQFVESLL